jgi:RNA polymerase sigma-70 factor (ECF subfamily)
MRRRSNLAEKAARLVGPGELGPEPLVVRRSEDEAVLQAVGTLRPRDRETILLSAWEGLSAPQIAARFGISIAAAEKRLSRAKQRLGAALIRFDKRFDVAPGVAREGGTR